MREEITEPQHWRTNSQRNVNRNASWSSRRRSQENVELATEAIDAALADEELVTTDIISNLASQLDQLEKQQEQLRSLLAQAQANK